MALSAQTRLVGLIGWPVSHSRSPAMHNAAFAALEMDWAYVPLPVEPEPAERVLEAVRGLRALGFRGANVTVPHKQSVIPALDLLTEDARAMGAVNAIHVVLGGRLVGDNTDAAGFAADLEAHGVSVAGERVLVLGAGGSARAVVWALGQGGASEVVIANRTPERARELAESLRARLATFGATRITPMALEEAIRSHGEGSALIVNTTSLGMAPNVEGLPWLEEVPFRRGQTVYDLVYAPAATRLLQLAAAQGARALGGVGMLVQQGALAFSSFTGEPAPVEVMRSAAVAGADAVAGAAQAA